MKKLNIYPKFAKYALSFLFVIFTISATISITCNILELPHSITSDIAGATWIILTIPLASTFQYFINPVEREAKKIGFVDDNALMIKVKPLLGKINDPVRVGYFSSDSINAFAISSIVGENSLIAFSTALISTATDNQFLAFAAHETAHLKNGDAKNKAYILAFSHALQTYPYLFSELTKSTLAPLGKIFILLGIFVGSVLAFFTGIQAGWTFLWGWLRIIIHMGWPFAAAIVGYIGLNYILKCAFFAYSREREFTADADGAAMTSRDDMKSALELLTDPDMVIGIFDTHPPLEERKKRLCDQTS